MSLIKEKIIAEKELIISQIKKYCPPIKPFFNIDMTLREYSDSLYGFKSNESHLERQKLIKDKIRHKLKEIFGDKFEKELNLNLDGCLTFNIADHHQIINHPFLLSSNIVGNVSKLLKPSKQDAIIVISSGDVPPNNYFSKSGFSFHDKRVPIFSVSERELTSYYIPKRDFNFVERLKLSDRWKNFNQKEKDFLVAECEKIRLFDFSKCKNYIDQITVIVKNIWPYIFEEKLRPNVPDLLYLTQEEIVTECLLDLLTKENTISRCLFDKEFRNKVLDNFRGIVVTWDEKTEKGTHFFWRKNPEKDQSLRMYVAGDRLVPIDPKFKEYAVLLDKDTIIEMLRKREIYPSLFMIFGVLNFYAGAKPLVGYGSVIYLDLMKKAWIKTLEDFNLKDEANLVSQVEIDGLIAGLATFFKRYNRKLKALYAYDIFYENGVSEEYLEKVFNMKFGEIMSLSIVDMYDYFSQKYIPQKERISSSINFNDLAELVFDWI